MNRMRDAGQRLDHSRETLRRGLTHKIDNYRRGLVHIIAALQARSPARELLLRRNRFGDLERRFVELSARALEKARHRFQRIEGILRVLGPDATLRRGYSITRNERGELVRTVTAVRPKMKIRTRVRDGQFESTTDYLSKLNALREKIPCFGNFKTPVVASVTEVAPTIAPGPLKSLARSPVFRYWFVTNLLEYAPSEVMAGVV